ncbi:S8 family serine peptidase [Pelagicoccus albus]|uniref:S8 family serine peptidase n=1 Tax=Pelagicoccus albus TaxID=415222 RepID=A0A7X1E7D2_9BACT|nr:S8 family serine peptidase [Pelagicoccus albus]MBC2605615.1 S8 family serine peptidase [Pelagicoccus albus]
MKFSRILLATATLFLLGVVAYRLTLNTTNAPNGHANVSTVTNSETLNPETKLPVAKVTPSAPKAIQLPAEAMSYESLLDAFSFLPEQAELAPTQPQDSELQQMIATEMGAPHSSENVIVFLDKRTATAPAIASIAKRCEIASITRFENLGGGMILSLQRSQLSPEVEEVLLAFGESGLTRSIETDKLSYIQEATAPNDPNFDYQWGLDNQGVLFPGAIAGSDINVREAWDYQTSSKGTIVAIVDTGALTTHEDLQSNIWSGIGYDYESNDSDPTDEHGHGTHVAGIIGAVTNNGLGVSGVAQEADMMILKASGSSGGMPLSVILNCFSYAIANGASIVNASFGSTSYSSVQQESIEDLRTADIILVAAAGNYTANLDNEGFYPATYDLDNIVTVGASDCDDQIADFSNYGSTEVDIFAPGETIYSTYYTGTSKYGFKNGTSMAAPMVTGALSLIRANKPSLTYKQTIDFLLENCDEVSALTPYCIYGRLNVGAAIAASSAYVPEAPEGSDPLDFEPDSNDLLLLTESAITKWSIDETDTFQGYASLDGGEMGENWEPVGYGNIDADIEKEIVFHNTSDGRISYWNVDTGAFQSSETLQSIITASYSTEGLSLQAALDIDENGSLDLVWKDASNHMQVWMMENRARLSQHTVTSNEGYPLAILWNQIEDLNASNGKLTFLTDLNGTDHLVTKLDSNLSVETQSQVEISHRYGALKAFMDFNGDGHRDAYYYQRQQGRGLVFYMNNYEPQSFQYVKDANNDLSQWIPAAVADLDGNSQDELVWQHVTTGAIRYTDNHLDTESFSTYPSYSQSLTDSETAQTIKGSLLKGFADLDGDGKSDALFSQRDGSVFSMSVTSENAFALSHVAEADGSFGTISTEDLVISGDVAGIADIDLDGYLEILGSDSEGQLYSYTISGSSITNANHIDGTTLPAGATLVKLIDWNEDSFLDIVWADADGTLKVWILEYYTLIDEETILDETGSELVSPTIHDIYPQGSGIFKMAVSHSGSLEYWTFDSVTNRRTSQTPALDWLGDPLSLTSQSFPQF